MVFSSLIFIFRFLPVFLLVYYLVPEYWKNTVLLIGSIVFYAFGEPVYVILIICSVLINYLLARGIGSSGSKALRVFLLLVDITINLGLLAFFKYLGFIIVNINLLGGYSFKVPEIALPLGISFFTFHYMLRR